MATNSLHTNGTFSTFPLWGKLFADAGISPLSNTGEKVNPFPEIPCRKSRLKNAMSTYLIVDSCLTVRLFYLISAFLFSPRFPIISPLGN